MQFLSKGVAVAGLALVLAGSVWYDASGQAPKRSDPGKAKKADTAKPPIPDANRLAIPIHTSVVALSQANLTGNYTVLHALGAPSFQAANPPEKLAKLFANVRKIDLTPVIIFSPVLVKAPAIDDKNMHRLTGYYKTTPQQVLFDLLFQPVAGQWRLFGISIATQLPQPGTAPPGKPAK